MQPTYSPILAINSRSIYAHALYLRLSHRLAMTLLFCVLITPWASTAQADLTVKVGYLELIQPQPPLLSNVLPRPDDSGLQGAQLGLADNNAGGRFIGQQFQLQRAVSKKLATLIEQAKRWQTEGVELLVVNLPAEALLQLAAQFQGDQVLLFNIGSPDNNLRSQQCLTNVLHPLPSRAMLTDAPATVFHML